MLPPILPSAPTPGVPPIIPEDDFPVREPDAERMPDEEPLPNPDENRAPALHCHH